MKDIFLKAIFNKNKINNTLNAVENISFAATVGFVSGSIYGIEYYFGSLATGAIGFFLGGLAGFTFDRILPLK